MEGKNETKRRWSKRKSNSTYEIDTNFTKVPNDLIRNPLVSHVDLRFLACVLSYNPSYPSYLKIQENTGLSPNTINGCIKRAKSRNILKIATGNPRRSNQYELRPPSEWNFTEDSASAEVVRNSSGEAQHSSKDSSEPQPLLHKNTNRNIKVNKTNEQKKSPSSFNSFWPEVDRLLRDSKVVETLPIFCYRYFEKSGLDDELFTSLIEKLESHFYKTERQKEYGRKVIKATKEKYKEARYWLAVYEDQRRYREQNEKEQSKREHERNNAPQYVDQECVRIRSKILAFKSITTQEQQYLESKVIDFYGEVPYDLRSLIYDASIEVDRTSLIIDDDDLIDDLASPSDGTSLNQ